MLEVDILVGFCDKCQEYFLFNRRLHKSQCPQCKRPFSTATGKQLNTYRTFNMTGKKYKIKNERKFLQWLEDQD